MQQKLRKNFTVFFFTVLLASMFIIGSSFQTVKAQQQSSFSDDFSTDTHSWQYLWSAYTDVTGQYWEGKAFRDEINQYMVLTDGNGSQGGAAFFNSQIQGPFTANFSYKADGGDGFTMFFYKQKYSSIGTGGSLGFTPYTEVVPGYGIEFDGYQNTREEAKRSIGGEISPYGCDPSSSHIAVIKDSFANHLTYINDYRINDNKWHEVSVEVKESSIRIFVDQNLTLQWDGTIDRTYGGFGFSGSTGSFSGWHIIDDFSITTYDLQLPSLSTTCTSSVSQSSFKVEIKGDLTLNGIPISGAPVMLSYSVTCGKTWQELTSVHTDADGTYSAVWLLPVTGDYMLKAVFEGDEKYLGTSNIVSFAIEPYLEQSVFSVTSNSTLSELTFDSTRNELSFNVSGENGTTGYVYVCIPNSLVNDIADLKVYLDNNQVQYSVQSLNNGWILYATYHHSTHCILINLESNGNQEGVQPTKEPEPTHIQNLDLDWVKISILVVMVIFVALVAIVAIKSLKKN